MIFFGINSMSEAWNITKKKKKKQALLLHFRWSQLFPDRPIFLGLRLVAISLSKHAFIYLLGPETSVSLQMGTKVW